MHPNLWTFLCRGESSWGQLCKLEYTPGEVAPRFKSWNLRSRITHIEIYWRYWNCCFSPFIFVCFDVDQVKLRLQCQNIFSAARHLQFGNLRARSDWAMEILLCSLIPYPRQRKQRKPNNANNAQTIMGDGHVNTSTQRTRQGLFFARFGYLEHTLGSHYARWNGLSRTETSQSVHKLWSKLITLAQNAPARLNQMFVVWTQPSHSLVLHPSDKPQTFKSLKTLKNNKVRTSNTTKFWARFGPRKSYCTRWMRKKHVIFLILDCNATEPLKDHLRLSDLREQCDFQMCFEVA